jgi:hypothetical protein
MIRSELASRSLLRAVCVLVSLGILVAGLWPFHAPRNEVSWLSPGNGLRFGRHGSIVSASLFRLSGVPADNPCSVEIWLQPSRADASGTILAFYRPETGAVPFALRQSLDDLLIQLPSRKTDPKKARFYAAHVFNHAKRAFLIISSGPNGTTVYADGALVKKAPDFRFSSSDLSGQLIVGNSPTNTHTWSGQLRKIAFYNRELSADEAAEHFYNLGKSEAAIAARNKDAAAAAALYRFDEGSGNVVHNVSGLEDSAADLIIPERFFVLRQLFLESPRSEFHGGWNYWKNIGINIAGFIPLGFFYCAYFLPVLKSKRAFLGTIVLGFFTSLTIEVLQACLPTRDSGTTDLITNTLGTALGAILCLWTMKRHWSVAGGVPVSSKEMRDLQLVK